MHLSQTVKLSERMKFLGSWRPKESESENAYSAILLDRSDLFIQFLKVNIYSIFFTKERTWPLWKNLKNIPLNQSPSLQAAGVWSWPLGRNCCGCRRSVLPWARSKKLWWWCETQVETPREQQMFERCKMPLLVKHGTHEKGKTLQISRFFGSRV